MTNIEDEKSLYMGGKKVKKGDIIKAGTEIAKSGGKQGTPGAGSSTGAHLHLEVLENDKFVNPENYFKL